MLSFMLSVKLNVTNKPLMLSVIMLNVVTPIFSLASVDVELLAIYPVLHHLAEEFVT